MAWYAELQRIKWHCIKGFDAIRFYKKYQYDKWYNSLTNEEKENIGIFANEKIMAELIPVIDNMERALDSADKGTAVYQGVELVLKQLLDTLGKFGLKEIPAEDEPFDPNFHQAVMQDHICGVEPGKGVDVLQKGYKLNEKVVRATMVKVSC